MTPLVAGFVCLFALMLLCGPESWLRAAASRAPVRRNLRPKPEKSELPEELKTLATAINLPATRLV